MSTPYTTHSTAPAACTRRRLAASRQRYELANTAVATQPIHARVISGGHVRRGRAVADRQRIGPALVPVRDHEPAGREPRADAGPVPAGDLLEDRDQHREAPVAENGAATDGGQV